MLTRPHRLTATKDIEKVWKRGHYFSTPVFGLKILRTGAPVSRFAVVAGLQVHKRAVKRNLAKRRIREALRKHIMSIAPGFDSVITARAPIVGKSYAEIEETLVWALHKVGLLI
ncbi:ribonuclease P protein component [Candidatus Uhrbacteria bacterium RIFCSPHIGHO2_02_FULL_57_19]|uniref:Ribonuclease P protein component n=1 Tax=Candidatus Uhrbacteria bacterium RIFCSPHIGHO2_02_FULL_57_19 TaxID=1802391 RepID=A0A1F7U3N5_9BACT|nr:MAG: ribonuclease P protein component [Candidatus Uhrbacteria bacterium RIFCSPHIGHO2_02_FULL_57_19]